MPGPTATVGTAIGRIAIDRAVANVAEGGGVTPARQLVLIGGGHVHAIVLRDLVLQPDPHLEITLIARELRAPYSGMLPGFVAGHYDLDACHIDLVRLAKAAGARLVHGEADGIDMGTKRVRLRGGRAIAFDLLSVNTGITPAVDDITGADDHAIAVKPVTTFAAKWQALERQALTARGPRRFVVVGTGAGGFELVLAMRHRLLRVASDRGVSPDAFSFALVGSGPLLPHHNVRARRLAARELEQARVELSQCDAAVEIGEGFVRLASGRMVASDAVLMATKAAPPAWFREAGLALDGHGFLAVEPTLQVCGEADIFAAGDCATVLAYPREKAGVFAVRQGPPLARNLRLRARGMAALPFVPQVHFLTLLACGDKRAIAARGQLAAAGRWAWHLKDRIDRRFMRGFEVETHPGGDASGPALTSS